ncbi:MAG: cupin domain-containing protein [Agriterribacter sp.]
MHIPLQYRLRDNGIFPNSKLPVLLYKNALSLPFLFPGHAVKKLFSQHGWTNNWISGFFTYNHYHSNTHEVIGVVSGKTNIQLGGDNGVRLEICSGDVLIIPAGVAHKNMGKEKDIICVGGYPDGKRYDINIGSDGERPQTDKNISAVAVPSTDPIMGNNAGLLLLWRNLIAE